MTAEERREKARLRSPSRSPVSASRYSCSSHVTEGQLGASWLIFLKDRMGAAELACPYRVIQFEY